MNEKFSYLLAGLSLIVAAVSIGATTLRTEFTDVVGPVTTPQPTPTPVPMPLVVPESIEIPSLGVIAPVVGTALEGDSIAVPKNARDIAWWGESIPGYHNALFAGHRDYNGAVGSFIGIGQLKPGDKILVKGAVFQRENDRPSKAGLVSPSGTLEFTVEWVQSVGANVDATEILADQAQPVITLVTCSGPFNRVIRHYTERLVVRAGNPVRV